MSSASGSTSRYEREAALQVSAELRGAERFLGLAAEMAQVAGDEGMCDDLLNIAREVRRCLISWKAEHQCL
jgi:hypothetical protein